MFNSILLLCFIYHLSVIVNKPIPFASCAISNPYQIHIWAIYGSRTTPDASIGLVPYQTHIKSISGPYMGHPRSQNWTLDFEPAFSQRFYFPLSPRSIFPTRQRFPLPNHVTSGCMSLRSFFPTGQRFPILKTRDFRFRL